MLPTTALSSVTWTWSPWMTAIYTAVVISPDTLPLPWTSLASGEVLLSARPRPPCPSFTWVLTPSSVPCCWPLTMACIILARTGPFWTLDSVSSPNPDSDPLQLLLIPALPCHRLPYAGYFGGVSGLSKAQFLRINGFPNEYWGWGGEDDDIFNR